MAVVEDFQIDRPGHAVITVKDAEGNSHNADIHWPTDWTPERQIARVIGQVISHVNFLSNYKSDPEWQATHIEAIMRDAARYGTD